VSARRARNDAEIRLGGADSAKVTPMTGANARNMIGQVVRTIAYLDERDSGTEETDAA
jgi:hypothetical protein